MPATSKSPSSDSVEKEGSRKPKDMGRALPTTPPMHPIRVLLGLIAGASLARPQNRPLKYAPGIREPDAEKEHGHQVVRLLAPTSCLKKQQRRATQDAEEEHAAQRQKGVGRIALRALEQGPYRDQQDRRHQQRGEVVARALAPEVAAQTQDQQAARQAMGR